MINNRFVLTAAHCVRKIPNDWKLTKVRLGESNTSTNPDCEDFHIDDKICNDPYVEVPVAETIIHPEYHSDGVAEYNDIALLKLEHDVQFTHFIKPICLPVESSSRNIDFTQQGLEDAGFGRSGTNFTSPTKRRAYLAGLNQTDCQARYSAKNIDIHKNHVNYLERLNFSE